MIPHPSHLNLNHQSQSPQAKAPNPDQAINPLYLPSLRSNLRYQISHRYPVSRVLVQDRQVNQHSCHPYLAVPVHPICRQVNQHSCHPHLAVPVHPICRQPNRLSNLQVNLQVNHLRSLAQVHNQVLLSSLLKSLALAHSQVQVQYHRPIRHRVRSLVEVQFLRPTLLDLQ